MTLKKIKHTSEADCEINEIHLCVCVVKRRPPCVILDLFMDFRDGSRLLDLLEVMSGQRLVSRLLSSTASLPTDDAESAFAFKPLTDSHVWLRRVGREARECFSTGATLKRPSPF